MRMILSLAFLLCWTPFFAQSEYSILSIPKGLTEYANSVVIEENIEVDVTNISKMKTKKRKVVAVLNKLGDKNLEMYEYYDDNTRVKSIQARVYDAFGNEKNRYKRKQFADVSRTGINMYSDSRVMFLDYTPTSYPYIVVFESEVESGDSAFIDPWNPLGYDYSVSAIKSEYRIKYDPSNKPRYHVQNLDGYDISISENPDEMLFAASNLKAIRYEEHSPIRAKIFPRIMVALDKFQLKGTSGTARNWKEFGSWMEESLLADMRDLPPGTISRVKRMVERETTNEAKARKIYQFVQDKVRYISIQIGIGGWKPMPASDVDKLSYGDCKALTNYTKALLDAVGVPSYYTVLYGNESKWDLVDGFASVQGNHVILGVPDGENITWLECTSQDTPYGFIGDFTDDRDVLVITPEGGEIVHTKIFETEESLQENHSKIYIDEAGNVTADFTGVSQGIQYGHKYQLPKKKKDEVESFYKNRWRNINGFSIEKFEFHNDSETVSFVENVNVIIPNGANAVGDDFLFCPNLFNQHTYIPPRIKNRKQKLAIERGFVDIDTVVVEIPKDFIMKLPPEPTVLETAFGKYEISFTQISDNTLQYSRKLQIEKGEYPSSEYDNYRDFLRSIVRLDKTKILLNQNIQ